MALWSWVWIALLVALGIASGAGWPGWLLIGLGVFLIFPPLWSRASSNGCDTRERPRKFSAVAVTVLSMISTIGAALGGASAAEAGPVVAEWQYQSGIDRMRGTRWWEASVNAAEKAQVGFPYEGGTAARILLSQSSNEGPFNQQATLILENGQIDCYECIIELKFDDGRVFESHGRRTFCGEAQCLNLNVFRDGNYDPDIGNFAQNLVSAQKVTIEVPVYRFGSFQYTFDVAGLQWPQPGAPKA